MHWRRCNWTEVNFILFMLYLVIFVIVVLCEVYAMLHEVYAMLTHVVYLIIVAKQYFYFI